VQAMSLIHQKLYLSDNVTTINMQTYIRELVSYLRDSFDTRQKIRFELELEPIDLDIAQAIPLGLILNESITNSIKYAFPDERQGLIGISIRQPSSGHFELVVQDNGVGLPPDLKILKSDSLGIRLMHGLSNEIGGEFMMIGEEGTVVSVKFEVAELFRNEAANIYADELTFQS
jgi:two-component sensor histidine kinase